MNRFGLNEHFQLFSEVETDGEQSSGQNTSSSCRRRNSFPASEQSGVPPDRQISKKLAWLLRHGAADELVLMRPDGYVRLADVLAHKTFSRYSEPELLRVVRSNEKKRFSVTEDKGEKFIRANQGHSIRSVKTHLLMRDVKDATEIPTCIHGTYLRNWRPIRQTGISRMSRNHIHFSPGLLGEKGVISGYRLNSELYLYIDTRRAMNDGIQFFISENRVILSNGKGGVMPPEYICKAIVAASGDDLLQE